MFCKFTVSGSTDQKIQAIKIIRTITDFGLKESKAIIDDIIDGGNYEFSVENNTQRNEWRKQFKELGLHTSALDNYNDQIEDLLREALNIAVNNKEDELAIGVLNLIQTLEI